MDPEQQAWSRLNRLLLSVRDFQQALSAATFLCEDMEEARGLAAVRRLRCYETNMVVAYARPFSQAHGTVGRLRLGDLGVSLDVAEQALHIRLIEQRNRLYAHSDAEIVPLGMNLLDTALGDDRPNHQFLMPSFDEGCGFTEEAVFKVQKLCRKLLRVALDDAQRDAATFNERFQVVNFDARLDRS